GLTHVLRASGARLGLCDETALAALSEVSGEHGIRFLADASSTATLPPGVTSLADVLPATASEPDIPDLRGRDVFLYIYTSGTTGYRKPAIVRPLRFRMGGVSLSQMLGIEEGETIYAPLPLYHGESLFVGFAPAFRAGGAFASRRQFSAGAFLDDVRRHQAVAFVYVGELCRYLLRQPPTPAARGPGLRRTAARRVERVPGALRHPAHHRDVRRHRRQRRAAESRRPRRIGGQAARAARGPGRAGALRSRSRGHRTPARRPRRRVRRRR